MDNFDPVNKPSHYHADIPPELEPIKVIEGWSVNFHLGQVLKYIARAGKKDPLLQDLKKARWYLDRYISNLEGQS